MTGMTHAQKPTVRTWSAAAGNGTVELTAHKFWESPAAIRAFAQDDITVAIVEPEAQAMLLDFDRAAIHRSVAAEARS